MNIAPPTPKGFRDINPELAKRRREVLGKIVGTLEEFGFVPIETPTIEFADTLKGKYGEAERLIYEFTDRGGRRLALRYDLTVPLARYVATHNPPLPFRRYQIGQVFRGENPQRCRWREFTQLDFDAVGSNDLTEDTRIITAAIGAAEKLGIKVKMRINDRKIFDSYLEAFDLDENIRNKVIIAIDKILKIEASGVAAELMNLGIDQERAEKIMNGLQNIQKSETLIDLFKLLEKEGLRENIQFVFDPTLARGLNYYTGSIFELQTLEVTKIDLGEVIPETSSTYKLAIGGGGRYDNLIGMFAKKDIPAVGFSFGLDRLIELTS